jgi:hypothetical protein
MSASQRKLNTLETHGATRVASDLLYELEAAHLIIRNALNLMTTAQKMQWANVNECTGVSGEGATRANEREAVIVQASKKVAI